MDTIADKLEQKHDTIESLREAATEKMSMFVRLKGGKQRFLFSDGSYIDICENESEENNFCDGYYLDKLN